MKLSNEAERTTDRLNDKESNVYLSQINSLLKEEEPLFPKQSIDKQILACSYREMKTDKEDLFVIREESNELKFVGLNRWWKRIALPSFIFGSLAMTIFAFQVLFQPLFDHQEVYLQQASNDALPLNERQIQQDVLIEMNDIELDSPLFQESKSRIVRENMNQKVLAEFVENQKIPRPDPRHILSEQNQSKRQVLKGFILGEETASSNNNEKGAIGSLESQNIYTGSKLRKSTYLEKEAWVKKIVKLINEDKLVNAKSEIERFKNAYPNHPIESQIDLLKN